MKPDALTYSTIVATYRAYTDPIVAARRGEKFLGEANSTLQGHSQQSNLLFSTVIDTVAKAGNIERAQTLLKEHMERQAISDAVYIGPKDQGTGACLVASILEAYCSRIDKQPHLVVEQMEGFLLEMESIAAANKKLASFRPNEVCYAKLVGAYAALRNPQRAESVLLHVLELNDSRTIAEKMPLTCVWNAVLDVWVKSSHPETTQRVSQMLSDMEERGKIDQACKPDVITYNIFMHCLANNTLGKRSENALEAQRLIDQMQSGEKEIQPNEVSFDIVLFAWCKAKYPDNAEKLLVRLCKAAVDAYKSETPASKAQTVAKPTSRHFTTVMNGWADIAKKQQRSSQPIERIENLLKAMQTFYDLYGFDTKPSLIAYGIFLNCLSHSNDPLGPERAEAMLHFIQENATKDHSSGQDSVMFNSVLTAWLKSSRMDALPRAENIFNAMKAMHSESNLLLSVQSYTTLLSIYAKHNRPDKAQALFDEMSASKHFKPTFHSYVELLHAWSNIGSPETAAFVLQQLVQEFKLGKFARDVKPSIVAFNAVLSAWLKSNRPDAAVQAEVGLRSLYSLAASSQFDWNGPDINSFSTVIKAYSFSNHPDRADRSLILFNDMRNRFRQTGNPLIRPDLRIFVDLIHVLVSTENPSVTTINELFDQMASDSLHWKTEGDFVCRRLASILNQSLHLGASDKTALMKRLHSMSRQHSVEVDQTTSTLFGTDIS